MPSHSGTYKVKAENAGGEAECIADFIVLETEPQTEPNLQMKTHVIFKDVREETVQVRLVADEVCLICVIIICTVPSFYLLKVRNEVFNVCY
jgi:hypothetical protein